MWQAFQICFTVFGHNLFRTDDDFNKTQLTETGADSGKAINMKVVDNFETFSKSVNTPS
jgi:hypothetical protein